MRRRGHGAVRACPPAIEVIPNGVDLPHWRRPRPRCGGPRAVGGPDRSSGSRAAWSTKRACSTCWTRCRGCAGGTATAGGDRRRRPAPRRTGDRQRRTAPRVTFAGFLGPALPSTMACTDAMVVPSFYEPFGLVALEAAAAGAPLAVSATGGLAEIVRPGVTGVTFPVRDAGRVERVRQLPDQRPRGGARHGLHAARTMVRERYGWHYVAVATAAVVYASVVSGARVKQPANLWRNPAILGSAGPCTSPRATCWSRRGCCRELQRGNAGRRRCRRRSGTDAGC